MLDLTKKHQMETNKSMLIGEKLLKNKKYAISDNIIQLELK